MSYLTEEQLFLQVKIQFEFDGQKDIVSCPLGGNFELVQQKICQIIKKPLNLIHFVSNHKIVDSFNNKLIFNCTFLFPHLSLKVFPREKVKFVDKICSEFTSNHQDILNDTKIRDEFRQTNEILIEKLNKSKTLYELENNDLNKIQGVQEFRINQLKQFIDIEGFFLNLFQLIYQFKYENFEIQNIKFKLNQTEKQHQLQQFEIQQMEEKVIQTHISEQEKIEQQHKLEMKKQKLDEINSEKKSFQSELQIKEENFHQIEMEFQKQTKNLNFKTKNIFHFELPYYQNFITEQEMNFLVSPTKEINSSF
jgi:hypothetical protein